MTPYAAPACGRPRHAAPPEPVTLAWLWDSLPLRAALARVDMAAVVAVFRAAAGLSQHELADILGWSQSSLSLFESGQRYTLYDIRELLRFTDAVDMPREALLPLVLGQTFADPLDAWLADVPLADGDGLEGTDVDLDRRGFATAITGAAAAVMLPGDHELAVPAKVTASHVRYLKTCAENLSSRDQAIGGAALLKQAVRQWQRAKRMLDESDYTEAVGRNLLSVTGDLAVEVGWLAFDAGRSSGSPGRWTRKPCARRAVWVTLALPHMSWSCHRWSARISHDRMAGRPCAQGLRLAERAANGPPMSRCRDYTR